MRILLEKNKKLKCVQESMSNVENLDIIENDILENENFIEADLIVIYCDSIEDINKYRQIDFKDVLIVTSNMNTKFLYTAIMTLQPLDVISATLSKQAIYVRITSSIEFLKENEL